MAKGISVIICCYNSADRIRSTLKHLSLQSTNKEINWEVIVVDNNCRDDTVAVAKAEWEGFAIEIPLHVVTEVEPGLSQARVKGIIEASYEYVIFCDDDNWFATNYIQRAFEIMQSDDCIGAAGGRSEILSNIEIPYWFNTYRSNYAVGVQNIDSGFLTNRRHVWGAGMVLRRKVFIDLLAAGFTFNCSDRKGSKITSGGDSEICRWLLLVGFRLWYDEDLQFQHCIPSDRLSKDYWKNLYSGFLLSSRELRLYDLALDAFANQKNKRYRSILFKIKMICDNIWAMLFDRSEYYNRRFELQRLFPNIKKLVVNKKYWNIIRARETFLTNQKSDKI